jgi:Mrp family chromosome partitioning ATPase
MEERPMRKIAFYGKGGIGKSTTAANVSAAFAEKGFHSVVIWENLSGVWRKSNYSYC